jgi:hypothetical protein
MREHFATKSPADAATFLDDDAELEAEELEFLRAWTDREEVRRFLTIISEQARRALANTDEPGMLQL